MRITPTLILAAFSAINLSACASSPAAFSDTDRRSIRAAIADFTDAINKGDFARAAGWYSEDGVTMPPNAPAVQGRAAIQQNFAYFGRVQSFSQPVVEVDGVGDLAYARVNYDLTFTPPGAASSISDKGKVLIVMRKQSDGNWRTIRGMYNSNLPAPR